MRLPTVSHSGTLVALLFGKSLYARLKLAPDFLVTCMEPHPMVVFLQGKHIKYITIYL